MVSDRKPGDVDKPASGDVDDLVARLQLDGLQYRDFSTRRPAVLGLAGGREAPPLTPAAAAAPKAPLPPQPVAARSPEPPRAPAAEPAVTHKVLATPVSSAFERLRRQVVGPRGDAPVLSLHIPVRRVVKRARESLLEQALADVFARLAAAKPPSQ